jgi:membrane protein YqaA with SNARE-associated domain
MLTWVQELAAWMVGWAQTPAGSVALFWLAFAESSFFPLPPDLLLLALDLLEPARGFWFALICTVGSTLGGAAGYAVGRWGGRPVLLRFVAPGKVALIEQQFQRYDVWAVGIAGFTPIPYKMFTIAGGAFRLRFWRFLAVSFVTRGARFFLVSLVVFVFGEQAKTFIREYFELFTIGFTALLIGGFLVVRWAARAAQRPSSDA